MLLTKIKPKPKAKDTSKTKDAAQLRRLFERLMFELGLYNKFNQTYGLYIQAKTNYGYYAKLYLRPGLSFIKLQEYTHVINENLKCLWIMEVEQMQDHADVKIVTESMDPYKEYEDPHIKPYEMYMGIDFSQNVIKNDNNKNQMFMIGGAIGTGKTRFLSMVLLSWIIDCAVNEVEIYLSDIAKNEYVNFKYVKHVRYYAEDLTQLFKMMRYIEIKIEKRKRTISKAREEGWATNIQEYNKNSKAGKLSYCYIVIDEFSVLAPDKSDNDTEKVQKQYILDVLKRVSKIGRSLGIFCVTCLQKTTKDELGGLSIIKNMSAVRISFRANDRVSSEVLIGDDSAVGLKDRYAVYSLNGGDKKDYLYSPYISTEALNNILFRYEDHRKRPINIDYEIMSNEPIKQETRIVKKSKAPQYELIDTKKDYINVSGDDMLDY
jgi:DNA segregation ATPase FtsK/SpoIIIE-like protein